MKGKSLQFKAGVACIVVAVVITAICICCSL